MFFDQTTGGGKCNLPNSLTLLLVKFKPATNYLREAVRIINHWRLSIWKRKGLLKHVPQGFDYFRIWKFFYTSTSEGTMVPGQMA